MNTVQTGILIYPARGSVHVKRPTITDGWTSFVFKQRGYHRKLTNSPLRPVCSCEEVGNGNIIPVILGTSGHIAIKNINL